jgi:palmitoyl transferase
MFYLSLRRALAALLLSCPLWVLAQSEPVANKPFYREFWDETFASTSKTLKEGEWSVIVPARTYHMHFAYTEEQRAKQNDNPMPGIGIERGRYLENGDWSSIYAMEFQDSYDKPEWHLAYEYDWLWKTGGGVRYGLGATAGLMMRADYANYTPLPFILPTFHLGWNRVSLEATYVPGAKKGTGNVAFFWLKIHQ